MATAHVPVSRDLSLPPCYAHVQGYLDRHDPALRLRRSAVKPHVFILERRCHRRSPLHTGFRDRSDVHVQARDGYIHVASVHPNFLNKPWNIIRKLHEDGVDLFATTAEKVDNQELYEKAWAKETRRRKRLEEYRAIALEGYDLLSRLGGKDGLDRTRYSSQTGPTRLNGKIVTTDVH